MFNSTSLESPYSIQKEIQQTETALSGKLSEMERYAKSRYLATLRQKLIRCQVSNA
jgi:hypothetical protein